MKVGNLIRCSDTDRIGIILEIRRAGIKTMVLVEWSADLNVKWVDAVDLKVIGD